MDLKAEAALVTAAIWRRTWRRPVESSSRRRGVAKRRGGLSEGSNGGISTRAARRGRQRLVAMGSWREEERGLSGTAQRDEGSTAGGRSGSLEDLVADGCCRGWGGRRWESGRGQQRGERLQVTNRATTLVVGDLNGRRRSSRVAWAAANSGEGWRRGCRRGARGAGGGGAGRGCRVRGEQRGQADGEGTRAEGFVGGGAARVELRGRRRWEAEAAVEAGKG